jgi:hypothetical protein
MATPKKTSKKKTQAKKNLANDQATNDQTNNDQTNNDQANNDQANNDQGPSELHQRATVAVQEMFRLWPLESARWLMHAGKVEKSSLKLLEARWIEQARRGPAYVVPPPRDEPDAPITTESLISRLFEDSLVKEAAESNGKLQVKAVHIDFDEAARQTLAKGGANIELLTLIQSGKHKPQEMLFGVILADEHEKGSEMPWLVLDTTTWHFVIFRQIRKDGQGPCFATLPLYLWPGTGLRDPQESCSVITKKMELPGLLGSITKLGTKEDSTTRKTNVERLKRQKRLDQCRREAADRRKSLMGETGITENELASLVPEIDVDNDFISLIQNYDIVRIWEIPFDTLLESLPLGCLGLALFGFRPSSLSAEHALERCAFTLRRELQRHPGADARRAALSLAALGSVFVEVSAVTRLLRAMKLL